MFKQRYDKYLRKETRPPHIMRNMLDDWFDSFKCSSSDEESRPARGRKDQITGETLFTSETKEAITECKKKAMYLQDPLPLDQMYDVIHPSPNSSHQVNEHLSRRRESCLESFHLMLAHFGNCGMRTSLADNLNLSGSARYNLAIRHKRHLLTLKNPERRKIPAAFETVVPFFNLTELQCVNQLAIAAGTTPQKALFEQVENLPEDNGERFFLEYLRWMRVAKPGNDFQDRCAYRLCALKTTQPVLQQQEKTTQELVNASNANTTTTITITPSPTTTEASQNNNSSATTTPPAAMLQPTAAHPSQQVQQVHQEPQHQTHYHYQHLASSLPVSTHQQQHPHMYMNQPMLPQFPQFPSWAMATTYPMITPTAAAVGYCCGPYRYWHNRPNRRGRPPHDDHCRHRLGNTGGKIECNPSLGLI